MKVYSPRWEHIVRLRSSSHLSSTHHGHVTSGIRTRKLSPRTFHFEEPSLYPYWIKVCPLIIDVCKHGSRISYRIPLKPARHSHDSIQSALFQPLIAPPSPSQGLVELQMSWRVRYVKDGYHKSYYQNPAGMSFMTLLTKLVTVARIQIARLGLRRNERFYKDGLWLAESYSNLDPDVSFLVWPLLT